MYYIRKFLTKYLLTKMTGNNDLNVRLFIKGFKHTLRDCLQSVIVVFPDHTHLLFFMH